MFCFFSLAIQSFLTAILLISLLLSCSTTRSTRGEVIAYKNKSSLALHAVTLHAQESSEELTAGVKQLGKSISSTVQGKMNMQENRMKEGMGEDSYANNSLIQALSIAKVIPTVRDALEELYEMMLPKCVIAAELGCASGPNTLMMIPELIDVTYSAYRNKMDIINCKNDVVIPEVKVFLNDLPGNDFNTISRSLSSLRKQLEEERGGDVGQYFISATPGSFHKRVFPSNFLHFAHTSNSAHWLSQVPKGLMNGKGEPINKGNIYISKTSPAGVLVAYREQFEQDFTSFLKSRGQEIVPRGRMVVNIMATTDTYGPQDYFMTDVLNVALKDMAIEGLIDQTKLDEFEIPFYPPTTEEVMGLIEGEGSFRLHKHEIFRVDWDLPKHAFGKDNHIRSKHNNSNIDLNVRAKFAAGPVKAGSEYMMAAQFGEHLMEDLYDRVTKLIAIRLANGSLKTFHHAISLIKN